MGGQHQHPELRVLLAQQERGVEALGGVSGRHPEVDHRDVRVAFADLLAQLVDVAGAACDLEPVEVERGRQTLAEEHVGVRQDQPRARGRVRHEPVR